MTLATARQAYQELSAKASEIARQLAFAAIALVWLFKESQPDGGIFVPRELVAPVVLALVALGADLLQYLVAALSWGAYARLQERRGVGEEQKFDAPAAINRVPLLLFFVKQAAVVVAYVMLFRELAHRLLG